MLYDFIDEYRIQASEVKENYDVVVEGYNKTLAKSNLDPGNYPVFAIDVMDISVPSRNKRRYTEAGLIDYVKDEHKVWSGIRSAVHNSGIPLLKHHRAIDPDSSYFKTPLAEDAYGRCIRAEYLKGKKEGQGIVRFYTVIFDPKVAEGLRNGKYTDFSIRAKSDSAKCDICGAERFDCDHIFGYYYDKKGNEYSYKPTDIPTKCANAVMGRLWFMEFSIVNIAACPNTKVVGEVTSGNEISTEGYTVVESVSVGDAFEEVAEIVRVNHKNDVKEELDMNFEELKEYFEEKFNRLSSEIESLKKSAKEPKMEETTKDSEQDILQDSIAMSVFFAETLKRGIADGKVDRLKGLMPILRQCYDSVLATEAYKEIFSEPIEVTLNRGITYEISRGGITFKEQAFPDLIKDVVPEEADSPKEETPKEEVVETTEPPKDEPPKEIEVTEEEELSETPKIKKKGIDNLEDTDNKNHTTDPNTIGRNRFMIIGKEILLTKNRR